MVVLNLRVLFIIFYGLFQCFLGFCLLYVANKIKEKKESFCTKCGEKVRDGYKYCKNCGKELHIGYNEIAVIIFSVLGILTIVSSLLYILFLFIISVFFNIL